MGSSRAPCTRSPSPSLHPRKRRSPMTEENLPTIRASLYASPRAAARIVEQQSLGTSPRSPAVIAAGAMLRTATGTRLTAMRTRVTPNHLTVQMLVIPQEPTPELTVPEVTLKVPKGKAMQLTPMGMVSLLAWPTRPGLESPVRASRVARERALPLATALRLTTSATYQELMMKLWEKLGKEPSTRPKGPTVSSDPPQIASVIPIRRKRR